MTEEELQALCKPPKLKSTAAYSDFYGIGYWLKEYVGYPQSFPILFHSDHGPAIEENLLPYEYESPYDKALFHNTLKIEDNKINKKFKEVYVTGSPFVYYYKMRNVKPAEKRNGTVSFPFHSTAAIDAILDWESYADQLNGLPEEYHPITVCLHHVDIDKGLHSIFLNKGIKVVTAGHKLDYKFTERFYDIIRDKKYATSNAYGSCVLYCVDFGIPFFYLGDQEIEMNNKANSSLKKGVNSLDVYLKYNRKVDRIFQSKELFKEPSDSISEEQKIFAQQVLGVHDALPAPVLKKLLWKQFYLNLHRIIWRWALSIAKKVYHKIKS